MGGSDTNYSCSRICKRRGIGSLIHIEAKLVSLHRCDTYSHLVSVNGDRSRCAKFLAQENRRRGLISKTVPGRSPV